MMGLKALALIALTVFLQWFAKAGSRAAGSRLDEIARDMDRPLPAGFLDSLERVSRMAGMLALLLVALGWLTVVAPLVAGSSSYILRALIVVAGVVVTVFAAELLPGMLVQVGPERAVWSFRGVFRALKFLTDPVYRVSAYLEGGARRLAGIGEERLEERAGTEILEAVSVGERGGYIGSEERRMIEGVIAFHDSQVHEVLTPRIDMVMVEENLPLSQAARVVVEAGHSRIPVYQENRDNIVGVLLAMDLIVHYVKGDFDSLTVGQIMRKPYFVPESKPISQLLKELRSRQTHMAVVLDEYGGTSGLVTIANMLKKVVGEITDEYDEAGSEPPIRRISPDAVEVDAKFNLEDFNKVMDIEIPEERDYDTLGGMAFSLLGRIPRVGDHFETSQAHFTILDADERKVKRLRVERLNRS